MSFQTPRLRKIRKSTFRLIPSLAILVGLAWPVAADNMRNKSSYFRKLDEVNSNTLTKLGDPVPVFKVTTIAGEEFDIEKLRGNVIYINLFTTWCGWCHWQEPFIKNLVWPRFKDEENFVMVAIAREEDAETVRRYAKKQGLPYATAPDPDRRIFALFADGNVARHYVIDAEGRIAYQSNDGAIEAAGECQVNEQGEISYEEFLGKRFGKMMEIIESELEKVREKSIAVE